MTQLPRDKEEILDPHGNAVERTAEATFGRFPVARPRLFQRLRFENLTEGVDDWVQSLNARQALSDESLGRKLARSDCRPKFKNRKIHDAYLQLSWIHVDIVDYVKMKQ